MLFNLIGRPFVPVVGIAAIIIAKSLITPTMQNLLAISAGL